MERTVQKVIKNCSTCHTFQKQAVMNHPAKSITATTIFERIGIDLIGGLPETKEGYKYIMVITEYVSKYPYAVAIKSKSALEVAENFAVYISLFGPPKILLSDQGMEFCNQILQNLCKINGIEHKVTAPYNPRTNGQTERFNQTLMEALRKHTALNPLEWNKWLPFVLMSYRRRIHNATNFSPYEIMFGKKMNWFEDWQPKINEDLHEAIINRSLELRKMIEEIQPIAVENIHRSKITQENVQDLRANVVDEALKPGTVVYKKVEGLLGKLQERYSGPYKIVELRNDGNYSLSNRYGHLLQQTVPLHKLKIISGSIEETEVYYVDKILKHRLNKEKEYEFYVKWEGYSDKFNQWISQDNFDSPKMIQEYFKSLESDSQKQPRTRSKMPKSNVLQTVLVILCCFTLTQAVNIHETFPFCDGHLNSKYVNINNFCVKTFQFSQTGEGSVKQINVLNKLSNPISGIGYQCKMEKIISKTHLGILGNEVVNSRTNIEELSAEECAYMISSKKCHGHEMICDNSNCYYEEEVSLSFNYIADLLFEAYKCSFAVRVISSTDENKVMIDKHKQPCKAKDLSCILHDSTVIWNKDVIHECPYEKILPDLTIRSLGANSNLWTTKIPKPKTIRLQPKEIITYHGHKRQTKDKQPSLLFKITEAITQCNHTMYTTSEGLYLILSNNTLNLSISNQKSADLKSHFELLEAEFDALQEQMYENFEILTTSVCNTNKNILQLFKLLENTYFYYSDITGTKVILYSNHGSVFEPTCLEIKKIEILENTKYCYIDTPVTFKYFNQTVHAFLNSNGILIPTSSLESCETSVQKVILPSGRILERHANKIIIKENFNTDESSINLMDIGLEKPNFEHHEGIIQDLNILQQVQNVFTMTEVNGGKFMVLPDSYQSYNPIAKATVDTIEVIKKESYTARKISLIVISILISVLLFFTLCSLYKFNCFPKLLFYLRVKREIRKQKQAQLIELREKVRKLRPIKQTKNTSLHTLQYESDNNKSNLILVNDSMEGINPEKDFAESKAKQSFTNNNVITDTPRNSLPTAISTFFNKK
jgi:hypothetical protein